MSMKRIACLSTLTNLPAGESGSEQLIELYNSTRVYNREHDVTGVFLVSGAYLLQILEGDGQTLANLLYRFSRESLSQDVSVVYKTDISQPKFQNWSIRFVGIGDDKHREFLGKLHTLLAGQLQPRSAQDQLRLQSFFGDLPSPATAAPQPVTEAVEKNAVSAPAKLHSHYEKCLISLSRWPKPSQLKLSHELIKLCSRLVRKPMLYERLRALDICQSEAVLVDYLRSLEALGILSAKRDTTNVRNIAASVPATAASPSPASARFSQVLRRFLSTSKVS